MNIDENIRKREKLVEKLPLHQLLTILYYKTWYQIKFET